MILIINKEKTTAKGKEINKSPSPQLPFQNMLHVLSSALFLLHSDGKFSIVEKYQQFKWF